MTSPRALIVAGLDPSAGAGLLLDAIVFAWRGYAPSAVATTLTAQNSASFHRAVAVEPDLIADQIEALLAEGPFACVKVGAVGSAENARLLGALLGTLASPVVVDPVLSSSSGGDLVGGADVAALDALCSAATVVTPNAEEATRLAGAGDPLDPAAVRRAGRVLARRWRTTVLVTGVSGASAPEAVDMLCAEDSTEPLAHALVPGLGDVRGTGCMHSSSLAADLGAGLAVRDAATSAQREVADLLRSAARLGSGRMQIDLGELPPSRAGRTGRCG